MEGESLPPWRKNLYENQGYADNYTDPTFLKDLQKNKNVKLFSLEEVLRGAARLNYQITCTTAFLIIFYFMYMDKVSPTYVFLLSGISTFTGYVVYVGRDFNLHLFLENSKTLLTVLIFGYLFSPLLYTLTDSVSTDTIFSMTFFVMILNLAFFDYGVDGPIVSKATSFNAACFGSICLASRLSSSYHAFVLLVVSAEFFVLLPIVTKKYWTPAYLLVSSGLCSLFLFYISMSLLITFLLIISFINFICPQIFVMQQKHKNNIHGPWDEAIVYHNIVS